MIQDNTVDAKTKKAFDFFVGKGWSQAQAAGIVANLLVESNGLVANALGDGGKAYGVAQWHPSRQADFMKKMNKTIIGSSLEDQFDFVNYELLVGKEKSGGKKLKDALTAAEAGSIVSKYYERPKKKDSAALQRGQIASAIYEKYKSK